ncbi:hypothetical protein EV586_103606 [Tumebacillus sp. BK434]|uniref:hypothetical protein n=1 Tax=Tumebacillus sp. BK434 TaxID=2512169 RepID=UPI001047FDCB|nr:hypothetical protein [Tumebacillus sp. BK434]TCP55947.1 hypothetical protein EV586_103606 [Tumebacillus sp. BK434]
MKVAFLGEGEIDDILLPPLITTIAKNKADVQWPLHFSADIRKNVGFGMGFGEVKVAVRKLVEALDADPAAFRKNFDYVIVLLDGARTTEAQNEIRELIEGKNEFIFGLAIKEVEAWILADRDHVIEWLGIGRRDCPTCRFWQAGYSPERDPDPKETLTQLLQASDSDYDVWCSGAAEEFVDEYWKGTFLPDDRIEMRDWSGKADLQTMAERCPYGYRPFEEEILRMLGRL